MGRLPRIYDISGVLRWPRLVAVVLGIAGTTFVYLLWSPVSLRPAAAPHSKTIQISQSTLPTNLPLALFEVGIYKEQDFVNQQGIRPPFWGGPTDTKQSPSWGPCFAPRLPVTRWNPHNKSSTPIVYPKAGLSSKAEETAGMCRPGFLIIGAGKCGTSSLYHYLVDHPRVLPAKQKQIHYFKYYPHRPLSWYYGFFPTTTSFLKMGALMTGEASPGYLPYPDVPHLIQKRIPGVRIIALGRNPIERMYSSYEYNYVRPTVEEMQKGRVSHIERNRDDEYYMSFLFSFEEMVAAELAWLKKCLDPATGSAVVQARKKWYSKFTWVRTEMDRREKLNLPPMADLDGYCYGDRVSKEVLRQQWASLQTDNKDKVILDHNTHLIQSIIGRSLYVLPLEWWFARFDKEDIHFVCTEELSDVSGKGVSRVADFLGLPGFNFSQVVQKGAYNVGGHQGYDNEVAWDIVANETHHASVLKPIPLSEDLLRQVQSFVQPFNERLFQMVGKQCQGW